MATTTTLESSGNIVSLSADTTFPITRAVWCGTAGTATLTSEAGQTLTDFPLVAGANQIRIKGVVSIGTAASLWAMY